MQCLSNPNVLHHDGRQTQRLSFAVKFQLIAGIPWNLASSLLATGDHLDQIEAHSARIQCAEVTGERA